MYNPQLETFIQAADSGSFSKAIESDIKKWLSDNEVCE